MSNRKRLRPLARHDGHTTTVAACCELVVTVGVDRIKARHDVGCPGLDPTTADGAHARLLADLAVARVVEQLVGGRVLPVVLT